MDTTNIKYDVEGFIRRVPTPVRPAPPPASDTHDIQIIEISSDDESDNESGGKSGENSVDSDLINMPIAELEIKREQIFRALSENDENEVEDNDGFELNRANAITEPENQLNEPNQTVTNTLGQQTPEQMDHQELPSSIGVLASNYDSVSESDDDDFQLDLRPPNQISQMPNLSTPKVQFRVAKSDQKQNPIKPEKPTNETTFRTPLKSLSENLVQNDDTTQMVPDPIFANSSYQDQTDDQFATENGFSQYATTPTLFEQQTASTLFPTPVHQPNYRVKQNQSYVLNGEMNNEQCLFGSPMSSVFLEPGSGTPLYTTAHGKELDDIVSEKVDVKFAEKIDDYIQNRLMKQLEEKGLVLLTKDEFNELKNVERKRSSPSPKNSSEDHGPDNSSSKRQKSSHHGDHERRRSSSSSSHNRSHGNHRSSSVKTEKSAHKSSTVTSGSLNQGHSNPSPMDYEDDQSSSSSNDSVFKQPAIEKGTKSGAPYSSGVQFKFKFNGNGKDKPYTLLNGAHRSASKPLDRAHKVGVRPKNQHRSVAKNTDKSLYLKSDKAKECPICPYKYQRIVSHMKTHHEEYEVYASRVSPEMAAMTKAKGGITGIKHIKNSGQQLKAMCLFCEEERDFMPQYWIDHLRSHTGEYHRRCHLCLRPACFHMHCSFPTELIDIRLNLYVNNLYAYLCRKCNYLQIDKKNIERHLQEQHEISDQSEQKKYYRKFMLLPALNNLSFTYSDGRGANQTKTQFNGKPAVQVPSSNPGPRPQPSPKAITVLENRVIRPAVDAASANAPEVENIERNNAEDEIESDDNNEPETTTNSNEYKVDPETEKALLSVYNTYDRNKLENKFMVRPWTDDDCAKKPIIDTLTQFALYKCMHPDCVYATDNKQHWESHMEKHIQMMDVLTKCHGPEFMNTVRHKLIKFRECPYCMHMARAAFQVTNHMDRHLRNAFQCAHCYYRCLEMDNMVLHYEKYHSDKLSVRNGRDVLLCNENVEFVDMDYDQITNMSVRKIRCKQICPSAGLCTEKFACFNSLAEHLKRCHPENDVYKCPYCMKSVGRSESELREHLQNVDEHPLIVKKKENQPNQVNLFPDFECIYCVNYGSNNIDTIKEHMCETHESDFLFIAARRSAKPEEDNGEAQLVYIGNLRDGFPLYKCLNPDDLDCMDASQLDIIMQIEMLKQKRDVVKTKAFTGQLPSIKFEEKQIDHISYDAYLTIGRDTQQRVPSASHSVDRATSHQTPPTNQTHETKAKPQNLYSVHNCSMEVQVETQPNQTVKSECRKMEYDPNELERKLAEIVHQPQCPPKISYKCISTEMAKDLENAHNSSYLTLLCKYCSEFIKMDKTHGLEPLITHLESPVCKKKAPCTAIIDVEKTMLQHRIAGKCDQKDDIVFLQEERTSNTLVYKLVRCQFKCLAPSCPITEPVNTVTALKKHHKELHSLRYLRSAIIQNSTVIQSNDPQQPIGSVDIETQQYSLNATFWCNRHQSNFATRLSALDHHNHFHLRESFEFSIKTVLLANRPETNDDHKFVVLQCLHCPKYFGSIESMHAHMDTVRARNPIDALYTIKRLVVCAECKIVSTLDELKKHYKLKHDGLALAPLHPIDNTCCGLCRKPEGSKAEREKHYKRAHQTGDTVNNKILQTILNQIDLNQIDLNKCQFTPGCCAETRFSPIDNCINFILLCKHRLICTAAECSEVGPFQQAQGLARHRREVHDENEEQVLAYIHNLKTIMLLLANMKIYFPNGFVTTKSAIENTAFGDRLRHEIGRSIQVVFNREKLYIKNSP